MFWEGEKRCASMFWEGEKIAARPDQLIAFTRCCHEALPIKYRDLLSAACNQTGAFKLPGGIRNGWPMDAQHFGEQVLSDLQ
jgi:hypothetical protein